MNKKQNLMTVCLFCALLLGFSLAFLILPDQSFSQQENRSLRTLPKFTWEKLFDGSFGEQINDYFADQFPVRDAMVGMKGICETALGKGENNGVLLGKDGQLAKVLFDALDANGGVLTETDSFDPVHLANGIAGINRAAANAQVPFYTLLTGRTWDVAASAFDYPHTFGDALWEQVRKGIAAEANLIDTLPLLREKYEAGEYVTYKTDHHWTTLGAYYAYTEVLGAFGMEGEILPMSAFEKEAASQAFYGTAWSAGGMKFVAPDVLELWRTENEGDFEVTADGKTLSGFYSMGYLEKKDQYSVFLDGTHDVVTVTQKTAEARPRLLLIKDSFANSMAPFLAQHFDLVLLNLSSARTDFTDVTALAQEYDADMVMLVYTVENMVTANKAANLK